jgi:HD-like signal output (HDOD) protein
MQQQGVILFVDSDSNQLQSLQRSLRDQRYRWRLLFADNCKTALAIMSREPVDILVSETRLDRTTGTDLLKQAKESRPLTTRLLFSGQALREPAQEMVHHAHQFIAKPCDKEMLIITLQRVMQLRNLLNNSAMREMINSLGTLPSLPDSYTRLIEMLRSETASVADVGLLVEQDIAMSAKVLQMVNSAFFGLPRRVASPLHAVTLLGIEAVTNLALSAGIFNQIDTSLVHAFGLNALWNHSLRVAGLTRQLYMEMGYTRQEADQPFMAGLLHDLGKLVLIIADTDEYRLIVKRAVQQNQPIYLKEEESLWTSHAAVGAYLMGLWGLPFDAVESVALHHKPELQRLDHPQCLVVYAANLLIHNQIDGIHLDHYAQIGLQAILGHERFARWMTITREYLDGEAA